MKNILIGILLLLSGIVFGQTSTSPGNQTFFLSSIADTNTLIGVRGRDALFVSSTNKFYKRTSYWALQATISTGSGTVSSVSVVSANGLAGTVATATTTPAITLTTTITGLLKGNGTAISAATPSTDYTIPADLTVYLTSATAASTYMPLVGAAFTTTTGIGHELTSSTLTSGSLFKLTGTSTANLTGAKMFEISSSGANSNSSVTKYGVYSSVTNTGTSSTNIAGYFAASGGSNNYALQVVGGNGAGWYFGDIGASNPTMWSTLTTPSASNYSLTSTGNITSLNSGAITRVNVNNITRLDFTSTTSTLANNLIINSSVTTGTGATAGTQLNYNSLTSGNGIDASTNSLTTGMLSQFTSTSTALSGTTPCAIKVMVSGANANTAVTATGINVSVSNTNATSGTNIAATFSASGATTANYGLLVTSGNVGIGTSTGVDLLTLNSASTGIILQSTVYSHGFATTIYSRPTAFGSISAFSNSNGGVLFSGIGNTANSAPALSYFGAINNTSASVTTPAIQFTALKRSGTDTAPIGSTDLAFAFTNGNSSWGSGTKIISIFGNGNTTIGGTTNISQLAIPVAPTASSNYGTLSIGSGAFDGSTSGFFTGSANGTHIAVNAASGSTADLMNLQVAGVDRYRFDKTGILYISGASSYTTALQVQQVSSGISYIYNTITSANSILNFGTKNAQRLSIDAEGQSAFTPATHAPSSGSTAFYDVSITGTHAATNAASGAYKPLNITYTINNTGTASTATATGIFLNATETALNSMTHYLMDLQVGGTSKFKVTNSGGLLCTTINLTGALSSSGGSFTAAGSVVAGTAQGIGFTSRSFLKSGVDGNIVLLNNALSGFGLLQYGGETSSFPAIARDAANLRIVDASNGNASGLGIGESLPASAKLSVASTTQGALMPRMTTVQKNAISSPAEGLIVYDTDLHKLYVYDGSTWQAAW